MNVKREGQNRKRFQDVAQVHAQCVASISLHRRRCQHCFVDFYRLDKGLLLLSFGVFVFALNNKTNQDVDPVDLSMSGLYVFGCAFRSFLPRADLQRIALVNSPLSSIFIGRSVATVAELGFALQLARFFEMPLIFWTLLVAEVFSWFAITVDWALANFFENSLWTLVALAIGFQALVAGKLVVALVAAAYIVFMITVDLPMYLRRHRAHRGPYRSVAAGISTLINDWRVTDDYDEWREVVLVDARRRFFFSCSHVRRTQEMAWMAGYFSLAVWSSLWLLVNSRP